MRSDPVFLEVPELIEWTKISNEKGITAAQKRPVSEAMRANITAWCVRSPGSVCMHETDIAASPGVCCPVHTLTPPPTRASKLTPATRFFNHYMESFGRETVRDVMASVPHSMMWDDHDIYDGCGDAAAWPGVNGVG